MNTLRRCSAFSALALLLVAAGCGSATRIEAPAAALAPGEHQHEPRGHVDQTAIFDPVEFRQDIRKLWEDHITWTRLFIVSAIAGLPDVGPTAGRLLQNQDDIGAAIGAFYGDQAGAALSGLLRQHILVAADLVSAAKEGDRAAFVEHRRQWYANAREIAVFLAAANPAWTRTELGRMMREHLDQTLAEATALLTGNWAADIAQYDHIHVHILAMADVLAFGIIEQFPDRFGG